MGKKNTYLYVENVIYKKIEIKKYTKLLFKMTLNNNFSKDDDPGPWYECEKPDAKYIREDIFKKIKNGQMFCNQELSTFSDQVLNNILLECIPDTKTDFGSWRGYCTFGLDESTTYKIINTADNIKKIK